MANRLLKQRKMSDRERLEANRRRNKRRAEERRFKAGWKAYNKVAEKVALFWNRLTKKQRKRMKVNAGLRAPYQLGIRGNRGTFKVTTKEG